jgi:GT2 family glycosyltransferase
MAKEGRDAMVSVIIPTYNRAESLDRCLASLSKQDYPSMEVIVVDNSNDGATEDVLGKYPNVKEISVAKREAQARARNRGVESSSGEYVLFLDDDVVLINKDSVSNSVRTLEGDSGIGAVGGMIWSKDFEAGRMVVSAPVLLLQSLRWERYVSIGSGMKEVDTLQTSNLMMRKRLFTSLGGFDQSFKRVEDADLCYRIREDGHKVMLNFGSAVVHYNRGSSGARNLVGRMATDYYYRMRFQVKHFGLLRTNPLAVFDFRR